MAINPNDMRFKSAVVPDDLTFTDMRYRGRDELPITDMEDRTGGLRNFPGTRPETTKKFSVYLRQRLFIPKLTWTGFSS